MCMLGYGQTLWKDTQKHVTMNSSGKSNSVAVGHRQGKRLICFSLYTTFVLLNHMHKFPIQKQFVF